MESFKEVISEFSINEEQDENEVVKKISKVLKVVDNGELDNGIISIQLDKTKVTTGDQLDKLAKSGIVAKHFYVNAGHLFIEFAVKG